MSFVFQYIFNPPPPLDFANLYQRKSSVDLSSFFFNEFAINITNEIFKLNFPTLEDQYRAKVRSILFVSYDELLGLKLIHFLTVIIFILFLGSTLYFQVYKQHWKNENRVCRYFFSFLYLYFLFFGVFFNKLFKWLNEF